MAIDAPIRISTNPDELQDDSEFLGEITADEIGPSTYGPQYHLAVKPLNFAISGKTGWFHEWAKISRHKRSKLGYIALKFGEIFGTDKFLGQGTMVGQRAWFVRKDIIFGTDRDTGEEMKSEQVLMPSRVMVPGDEALILTSTSTGTPADRSAMQAPPTPSELLSFTDEEIGLILSAIDGADVKRLALVGSRTTLPAKLKQAVIAGTALEYLVQEGLVEVDSAGKVRDLVTSPVIEPETLPAEPAARGPRFAAKS